MSDLNTPLPSPSSTPAPTPSTDQSLDDILNQLEKEYNITPPTTTPSTTSAVKEAPVAPVKAEPVPMPSMKPMTPPVAPMATPAVSKPVMPVPAAPVTPPPAPVAPPKFEAKVQEHDISLPPKVDKVKPVAPPAMETAQTTAPVEPIIAKGKGFAALEETKEKMPNEFEDKKASTPPPVPPKKGASKVLKAVAGVVAVLTLVAGTFAVNKLVTQPQDLRQKADEACPGSDRCSPAGDASFCKGNDVWHHTCQMTANGNLCWTPDVGPDRTCANGTSCANGSCVPNGGNTCSAPCPFVQGPGGSGPSHTYYCPAFVCRTAADTGTCAQACDGGDKTPGVPDECYARQIDYVSGGYTLIDRTQFDNCNPPPNIAATCTSKKAYLANDCTDVSCIITSEPLAPGAAVHQGDKIMYELNAQATEGTIDNALFTDTLDDRFDWIASGNTNCSFDSTTRHVTCAKNSGFTSPASWMRRFLVQLKPSISGNPLNNSATLTGTGISASTCTNALTIAGPPSSPVCTALNGVPATIMPNTNFTAVCTATPLSPYFRFRVWYYDAAGNVTKIIDPPISTEHLGVLSGASGSMTVKCAPCPSSGIASCASFTDVCTKSLTIGTAPVCSSISISPAAPQRGAQVTATCSATGTNNYYRFRILHDGGTNYVDTTPSTSNQTQFTVDASGAMGVQCAVCTSSDATTCAAFDQITPGGAIAGTCTQAINPSSQLSCVGISINPATPTFNIPVTIRCGDASSVGATHYNFAYQVNAGAWMPLGASDSDPKISLPFTTSQAGTYGYRCQACDDTSCSAWDTAQ